MMEIYLQYMSCKRRGTKSSTFFPKKKKLSSKGQAKEKKKEVSILGSFWALAPWAPSELLLGQKKALKEPKKKPSFNLAPILELN